MQRRHLLQLLGVITLEPVLFGCQSAAVDRLKIQFLKQSLPTLLIKEFQQQTKGEISVSTIAQLADGWELLQKWSKPAASQPNQWPGESWRWPWQAPPSNSPANLITLGDYWLAQSIDQKLIKPINTSKITNWSQLDPKWQQLVTKDGQVWGAPYRWGSTILIYRQDKFRQAGLAAPTDWADLWQPELKNRISLLNQQQEVIGLTLKQLGHSYQTDPQTVPELPAKLRQLHQQVTLYSSDDYLSPLITGDTWLAMAWSHDVADLINRYSNLGVVIPQSGTSLWADLWVQPQLAKQVAKSPTIEQWIDFCLQPHIAQKISLFTNGLSPLTAQQFTSEMINHSGLNPTVFAKGEFLPTLSGSQQTAYQSLWRSMRE